MMVSIPGCEQYNHQLRVTSRTTLNILSHALGNPHQYLTFVVFYIK